jgi:hypothetical protein
MKRKQVVDLIVEIDERVKDVAEENIKYFKCTKESIYDNKNSKDKA